MKRIICFVAAFALLFTVVFAVSFSDVPDGKWYTEAVDYVSSRQLMQGTGKDSFSPELPMTRAMIVTVLWRLDGSVEATQPCVYSDVPADGECWYREAVCWASQNDIVSGVGGGRFHPLAGVTREQIAAIFYRYAAYKGYDTNKSASLHSFPDEEDVSDWAYTALSWATAVGLVSGAASAAGETLLVPQGNATRAQVAAVIMRWCRSLEEKPKNWIEIVDEDTDTGWSSLIH